MLHDTGISAYNIKITGDSTGDVSSSFFFFFFNFFIAIILKNKDSNN